MCYNRHGDNMKLGKDNPIFKDLKDRFKKNTNYILVDDLNSLEIAISFKYDIDTFIYCDDIEYHTSTKLIIDKALSLSKEYYTISKRMFETFLSKDNSIGFLAFIKPRILSLNDFKDKEFLVVCDRLEIPGNIGTLLRTMDSCKAEGMILVDPVSKILNPKMSQLSRGANLIIPTIEASYSDTLEYLSSNGYDIYLGEPKLGLDYQSYNYKGKIAIVIGNERFGINPDWYNHNHKKVYIPMEGHNNSLNVAVAGSILIYEAYMQRKK